MLIKTRTGTLAGAVGAAICVLPWHAWAGGELAQFHFGYRVVGPDASSPIQVFDDGTRTWFQFSAKGALPHIVAYDQQDRPVDVNVRNESPYVVVDAVSSRFDIGDGRARATARRDRRPSPWPTVSALVAGTARAADPADRAGTACPASEQRSDLIDCAQQVVRRATESHNAEALALVRRALQLLDGKVDAAAVASHDDSRAALLSGATIDPRRAPGALAHVALHEDILPSSATSLGRADRGAATPGAGGHVSASALPSGLPGTTMLAAVDQRVLGPTSRSGIPVTALGTGRGLADAVDSPGRVSEPSSGGVPPAPAMHTPASPRRGESVPQNRAEAAGAVVAAPDGTSVTPERPVPVSSSHVFQAAAGQRVSEALQGFLAAHGFALEWESASDFVVRRAYEIRAGSVEDVLLEVLGDYELNAVVYKANRVVAVSGAEPGRR